MNDCLRATPKLCIQKTVHYVLADKYAKSDWSMEHSPDLKDGNQSFEEVMIYQRL